jgi:glutamine synthetase
LLDNVYKIHQVYDKEKAVKLSAHDMGIIEEISERISVIKSKTEALVNARKVANKIESERAKAIEYHDTVVPYFDDIRYNVDKLELIIDDEQWTLPKYRELLFIR